MDYIKTIRNIFSKAITVGELREILEGKPDETPVFFEYNYGDHAQSRVCEPATDVILADMVYSDYHRMLQIETEVDDMDAEDDNHQVMTLVIKTE